MELQFFKDVIQTIHIFTCKLSLVFSEKHLPNIFCTEHEKASGSKLTFIPLEDILSLSFSKEPEFFPLNGFIPRFGRTGGGDSCKLEETILKFIYTMCTGQ